MASTKKDVAELEAMTGKLKRQFDSHIFCLDQKASNKQEILQEWHEYLRKRVELEADYNKRLESTSDRFLERLTRIRSATSTRGVAPTPSSTTSDLLYGMLAEAKALATRRSQYSDQLSGDVLSRIEVLIKDTTLISKKVKDIGAGMHDEMMKSHRELTDAARAYHSAYSTISESQSKLAKMQARSSKAKKGAISEKDKKKEMKLISTVMANKRDLIKCRNQYLLLLKGANVHTQRYFSKGLFELFEYADYDFQWSVSKIFGVQAESEIGISNMQREATESCVKLSQRLDTKQDLQRFMHDFGNYFYPPPEFQFIPAKKDEPQQLTVIDGIYEEMGKEREILFEKLSKLHLSVEEEGKTLECVEQNVANVQALVYDAGRQKQPTGILTVGEASTAATTAGDGGEEETLHPSPPAEVKRVPSSNVPGHSRNTSIGNVRSGVMNERKEHMDFLYNVLQRISNNKTSIDRWDSQHAMMDSTLADLTEEDVYRLTQAEIVTTIGVSLATQALPKLFGGNLDEYCAATNNPIPRVVRSCCKHIMEQGCKTEGVFRVPGPANEIDELRQKFEQDIDPLVKNDMVDVHAVASLLKQFFRDLKESIFPPSQYHALIRIHPAGGGEEQRRMIDEVRRIVESLPHNRHVLLQFLFRFLEDFSAFADQTKMTGSNIALVFGPTLIGNPPMDPQIMAQGMPLVNRTCLFMLDHRVEIFGDPPMADSTDAGAGQAKSEPFVDPISYPEPTPDESDTTEVHDGEVTADEGNGIVVPTVVEPSGVMAPHGDRPSRLFAGSQIYENVFKNKNQELETGGESIDNNSSESDSEGDVDDDTDQRLVHALHDYDARNEKELSFKRNEVIEVFQLTADGNWWDAVIGDTRGYIPASYVKELSADSALPVGSQTDSVDSQLMSSQSSQSSFAGIDSQFDRNPSIGSAANQPIAAATTLLALPEDEEAQSRGPSSAPAREAEHLGTDVGDDPRRRSFGEAYQTQHSDQPSTQPQGNVSTFGQPGSSASLDRVSAKVGMFAGGQLQGSSSRPPPVRAKPGKLKGNFEQLQGVIGGAPLGGAVAPRPGPRPSLEGNQPRDEVNARPQPIQGQRRPLRQ